VAKWTVEAIRRKIARLEPSRTTITRALWYSGSHVIAWTDKGIEPAGALPDTTVDRLMHSTSLDRDLYDTLVDVVSIDAVTAVEMCLS
jgi:hypothetical protein